MTSTKSITGSTPRGSLNGPLHRAAMSFIAESMSAANLLADYCAKKLTDQGVEVTPERLSELRQKFAQPIDGAGHISFDWDDVDETKVSLVPDADEALAFANDRTGGLEKYFQGLIDTFSVKRYKFVKENSRVLLRDQRYENDRLKVNLEWVWGESIDELQAFICANEAFVQEVAPRLIKWRRGYEKVRRTTVLRLQARACQVAKETVVLLQHGFADGALANAARNRCYRGIFAKYWRGSFANVC